MKSVIYIAMLTMSLVACSGAVKPKAPADLIGQEQFTEILKDVRLLEGAYASRFNKVDTSQYKIQAYYERLFVDHGVTKERFIASYSWYLNDHIKMLAIEDSVLSKITVMQSHQDSLNRLDNLQVIDSLQKDSLALKTVQGNLDDIKSPKSKP